MLTNGVYTANGRMHPVNPIVLVAAFCVLSAPGLSCGGGQASDTNPHGESAAKPSAKCSIVDQKCPAGCYGLTANSIDKQRSCKKAPEYVFCSDKGFGRAPATSCHVDSVTGQLIWMVNSPVTGVVPGFDRCNDDERSWVSGMPFCDSL